MPLWPPAVSLPHSALTTGLCSLSEEAALPGPISADLEASPKPTNPESPTVEEVTNPEIDADLEEEIQEADEECKHIEVVPDQELELAESSKTFVLLTMF